MKTAYKRLNQYDRFEIEKLNYTYYGCFKQNN